jgi:hypothetical protein
MNEEELRERAQLYGVATSNLKKPVKRNINRFPRDFVFQLTVQGPVL